MSVVLRNSTHHYHLIPLYYSENRRRDGFMRRSHGGGTSRPTPDLPTNIVKPQVKLSATEYSSQLRSLDFAREIVVDPMNFTQKQPHLNQVIPGIVAKIVSPQPASAVEY